jgi:hypothetical protein
VSFSQSRKQGENADSDCAQNITARLRNALGGGETLEGQASIGTKTKSAYSVSPSYQWNSSVVGRSNTVHSGISVNTSAGLAAVGICVVRILVRSGQYGLRLAPGASARCPSQAQRESTARLGGFL